MSRNDPCWCGSGKKWKKCHYPEEANETFEAKARRYYKTYGILLKTKDQIQGIRYACRLAANILKKTCEKAKEGVTTLELNDYAHQLHVAANARPAPLGYGDPPFPKSICTSLNEVICHGIPDDTKLKKGDILNIDVTCHINGYFGDCSAMVCIGEISEEKRRVVEASYECLKRSIQILKPGVLLKEIGDTIEECAKSYQCSVVNQFVGHGVGVLFHEPPQILHSHNKSEVPLAEGMTFTIEPMINAGKREGYIDPIDRWTARTVDGKPSAQWEHTIVITRDGAEVLTIPD
ncbi:MAG: methionyl aminopeptidase [Chlamydiales bacterium]|nr:methionyl aminopeptidase [Chlamydiales bacterium]